MTKRDLCVFFVMLLSVWNTPHTCSNTWINTGSAKSNFKHLLMLIHIFTLGTVCLQDCSFCSGKAYCSLLQFVWGKAWQHLTTCFLDLVWVTSYSVLAVCVTKRELTIGKQLSTDNSYCMCFLVQCESPNDQMDGSLKKCFEPENATFLVWKLLQGMMKLLVFELMQKAVQMSYWAVNVYRTDML